jgi:hypothetical protein
MDEEILENIWQCGLYCSCLSLACSFIILLIIVFNDILNSLTYKFLIWIFLSEIINSIGNLLGYSKQIDCLKNIPFSLFLIPFSDFLTMSLFGFFSFCSVELIKKSNKIIKDSQKKFVLISVIVSLIYGIIILIPYMIQNNDCKKEKPFSFYLFFINEDNYNFGIIGIAIHVVLLIGILVYISIETYIVIKFMKEKQNNDKINSNLIDKLIKVLFRYLLICILYLAFYIPFLIFYLIDKNNRITYASLLFCVLFLSSRGFLIFLNTMQTNKVQQVILRFFEVKIKYNLILSFNVFSNEKKKKKTKKQMEIIDRENDNSY